MYRIAFPVWFLLVVAPAICFGMGADHRPGNLPAHDGWGKGVYEAVNRPNRVHGFWINSSDTLFYKGSNADLQKMAGLLSQSESVKVEVILHAGKGEAKSPWSKNFVDNADWSVTIGGDDAISKIQNKVRIDVWLSGSITLDDLQFPPSVSVRSGKEIESFVNRHQRTGS